MSSIQEVNAQNGKLLRRTRNAVASLGIAAGSLILTAPLALADEGKGGSGAAADASQKASTLVQFITNFVGPILTLAIGIIAIKFLVQREMTKFFQFAAIAVLVGVLFFTPDLIQNLAKWFGNAFKGFFPQSGFIFFG
jgi:uncharacterized membrane protein YgdD (TMEM256/DUF423 family)